jgi:hypothetical protein
MRKARVVGINYYVHASELYGCTAVSEYQGEIVRVLDGDSPEVLHNGHAEHIFLSYIDCPTLRAI